jgi:hypothetical protein
MAKIFPDTHTADEPNPFFVESETPKSRAAS